MDKNKIPLINHIAGFVVMGLAIMITIITGHEEFDISLSVITPATLFFWLTIGAVVLRRSG